MVGIVNEQPSEGSRRRSVQGVGIKSVDLFHLVNHWAASGVWIKRQSATESAPVRAGNEVGLSGSVRSALG